MAEAVQAHDKVVQELAAGTASLRHAECHDRSAPHIESDVTLRAWYKDKLLDEIESGCNLKHIESISDKSGPHIEEGVHISTMNRADHLQAIQAAGAHSAVVHELKAVGQPPLKHVDTVDKAQPSISPDVHLKTWDKEGFLAEVQHPPPLHHVPQPAVKTGLPLLDGCVEVRRGSPREELLSSIKSSGAQQQLRHLAPGEVHDRSDPHVTHTAAMRVHRPPGST